MSTFIALLCLGVTLCPGTPVLTGTRPKSILRVQPDTVVSKQTKVAFLCEGMKGAKELHIYKDGAQYTQFTQILKYENKAEFYISNIDQNHAGRYQCCYQTHDGCSDYSDPLELVVAGEHSKPSLSAQPSPVVTSGGNVALQCDSRQQHDRFVLIKEGPQKLSWTLDSLYNFSARQYEALFFVGPVTSNQRWTFRCYSFDKNRPLVWSEPSDPLELLVSGLSKKPALLTHQGHILDLSKSLTLQCFSDINYDRFALYKMGGNDFTQHHGQWTQDGFSLANFTLGSASNSTSGQYRCYGSQNLSSEWSASSDPLDILITGHFPVTPVLSVKPNSTVHPGDHVTFLCWSRNPVDTFILYKEGKVHQPQRLKAMLQDSQYQAEFTLSAVTSAVSGSYRCYGSQNSSLYLLSYASAPVEIIISGPTEASSLPPLKSLPPSKPMPTPAEYPASLFRRLENCLMALVGVSVAFLLLLFILIFLLLPQRQQRKCRKEAKKEREFHIPAGAAELVTRDRGHQKRSNRAAATQEEGLYASVEDIQLEDGVELDSWRPMEIGHLGDISTKMKSSRLRRVRAILPSLMSREFLDTEEGQAEEGRKLDTQAVPSEEPQDVAYAQPLSRTFRQETAALPPSQAGQVSEEPVYVMLW